MNAKICSAVTCAVTIGAAACVGEPTDLSSRDGLDPLAEVADPSTSYFLQALHCSVDVSRRSPLDCAPVGGSGEAALIVGGQGVYVTLSSDGWSGPDPDGILTLTAVTIENHMIQKLGTADGEDPHPHGVRVFFQQLPGNGVKVLAPDSAAFLEEGQPFFQYNGIIGAVEGISEELDWEFDLNGQDHFEFGVLVAAPIPQEDGALRMVSRNLPESTVWADVWATSDDHAVAVGVVGAVATYDEPNDQWNSVDVGTTKDLNAVWASDPGNVWAVGNDGTMLHWDGEDWTPITDLNVSRHIHEVWGTPAGDSVFILTEVLGPYELLFGRVYVSHQSGGTWSFFQQLGPANQPQSLVDARAMHGTSSGNIWVGGNNSAGGANAARIARWNGASWEDKTPAPDINFNPGSINDIWVVSDQEVWAVGQNNTVIHTTNGGEDWEDMTPFDGLVQVQAVWAPSPNFVWVASSSGDIRYYDGHEWIEVVPGIGVGVPFRAIHGSSPGDAWIVGVSDWTQHLIR